MKKINFKQTDISLFQDNVDAALDPLERSPLIGGQLLESLSLISAQDNIVPHALGYAPTIILALVPNVSATIWSPNTATLHGSNVSASLINLRCSASCTVSVLVK